MSTPGDLGDGGTELSLVVTATLLGADVVILEGLLLGGVEPGEYLLACLPIKLVGSDGAGTALSFAGETLILAVNAIEETPDVVHAFDNEEEFVAWAREATPYGAEVTELHRKIQEERQRYYPYGDAEVCHQGSRPGVVASLGAGSLHEHANYGGGLRPLSAPNFGWVGFDNRGSSAISIGLSVLFDRTFYRGPTVWLFAIGIPNLGVFNFNDRASSAM